PVQQLVQADPLPGRRPQIPQRGGAYHVEDLPLYFELERTEAKVAQHFVTKRRTKPFATGRLLGADERATVYMRGSTNRSPLRSCTGLGAGSSSCRIISSENDLGSAIGRK